MGQVQEVEGVVEPSKGLGARGHGENHNCFLTREKTQGPPLPRERFPSNSQGYASGTLLMVYQKVSELADNPGATLAL